MTHREGDVISATGFGAAAGWLYAQYAFIHAWIPAWIGQLAITLLISCVTLTATHFLKRFLNFRFPDRKQSKGDSETAEPQEGDDVQ
jgi:hypothetical protein